MAYRPLQLGYNDSPMRATTTMSPKGINLRTAPQFLDPSHAQSIINYEIEDEGKLIKRKGLTKITEVAGNKAITMLKRWTDDIWVFGYDTTVAVYTISTDTVTTVKDDFSANDGFEGARYGDYFFVCNGVEKIWRIDIGGAISEIAASPICGTIKVIGPRLFAGNLSDDETAVQYSKVDTGANPPFNTWTDSTTATDGGKVYYRNAGTVRSIVSLGNNIVVFCDKGFYTFFIEEQDLGGVLTKFDQITKYQEDFGGARGAIETDQGIFYANEGGLWQMTGLGQQDIPFSKQEMNVTSLLGRDYFDNLDLSNSDITYSRKKHTVYLSCRKGGETNNFVMAYNTEFKAFSTFNGWKLNRWMNIDDTIYGASAQNTIIYQCFNGFTDDGLIIGTDYKQELKLGGLETKQMLKGCYVQGFLATSSEINVRFDIYDITGKPITDKLKYLWESQYVLNGADGYNSARYSSSPYGGDIDYANLVESFDGCRPFIRNFQRIILHITSSDKSLHTLTWVMLDSRVKRQIRRRKMTQIS